MLNVVRLRDVEPADLPVFYEHQQRRLYCAVDESDDAASCALSAARSG